MLLGAILFFTLSLLRLAGAQTPTTTTNSSQQFITVQNGAFMLNGQPFRYVGTSAYWLQLLDNDEDMTKALSDIANHGIKVVKTWGFNDVTEIPTNGPWIRAFLPNGTIVINTGENGLGRLDRIVRIAHQLGIYVLFSLTNNWAPRAVNATLLQQPDGSVLNGADLPRNYLSNDYGGMDTYVRHFAPNTTAELAHDTFYLNEDIRASFNEYAQTIVARYKDEPSVIAWEAANDPRCNSTLPASTLCTTSTITHWTSNATTVIRNSDPNHLVASGDAGFYCVDCTKVFPFVPPPQTSPGLRKRVEGPLTRAKILARDSAWKKRNLPPAPSRRTGGIAIRGKWFAPPESGMHKRQSNEFGPLYDGSFGVDTEDLSNVPGIDFSSFQYFPDQNSYAPLTTSSTSNFSEIVQSGVDWIKQHAQTANTYGKPSTLSGFGVVTNITSNTFAPFNSSVVTQSGIGTTQEQQIGAYTTWINAAIDAGVQGIIQYQWGVTNITNSSSSALTHQSGVGTVNTSPVSTFDSPNDGYATYDDAVKGALQAAASRIGTVSSSITKKRSLWEF